MLKSHLPSRAVLKQAPAKAFKKAATPCVSRKSRVSVNALLKPADGLNVTWSQTVDDVSIKVPVAPEVRGRDLKFEVHPKRLSLRLDTSPLLEGSLTDAGQVNIDECFWTLETDDDGQKYVAITLSKKNMGFQNWEMLLESERVDMTITDRVFLEVAIGGKKVGKIAVGLFGNTVPKTATNFKSLCEGFKSQTEEGKTLQFKGSTFHRIIPGFMAQGGDITNNDGTGGMSIYGPDFEDENFKIKHQESGFVAMANAGPNTNSSQFYILFGAASHLDGKHVVFGRVLAGMDIVLQLEAVGSGSGQPSEPVTITDSGVLADDAAVDAVMDENKMLQLEAATSA